jgi:hypothetical protein
LRANGEQFLVLSFEFSEPPAGCAQATPSPLQSSIINHPSSIAGAGAVI